MWIVAMWWEVTKRLEENVEILRSPPIAAAAHLPLLQAPMEGPVHWKSPAGTFSPSTLSLDPENNQLTWTKADGKSQGTCMLLSVLLPALTPHIGQRFHARGGQGEDGPG
jgi:hypothetical protein